MLSKKIICMDIENDYSDKYLYFDIETTGFSAKYHSVRMITYMYYINQKRYIEVHFAERKEDESLLLAEFIMMLKKHIALVHFNGNTFDIPFLNKRMNDLNLNYEIDKSNTIDLYKLIKAKYTFDSYTLKSLEKEFGIHREDEIDGAEWVKLIKEYDNGNFKVMDDLITHNYEDVINLENLINKAGIREEIESRIIKFNNSIYFIKNVILSKKHARIILYNKDEELNTDIDTITHKNVTLLLNKKFDNEPNFVKKKYILALDDNTMYSNIEFILRVGGGTQI